MTDLELHSLTELVAQFRRRAEWARMIDKNYEMIASCCGERDPNYPKALANAQRVKGKAMAYSNAADDLERFICTATSENEDA